MPALRIVTLNTWKNEGDYDRRLELMAMGLRALAPDVVLLQEVFSTNESGARNAHTGRTLAEALNLSLAYAPARAKQRTWQGAAVMSEAGLAVLIRGGITQQERLPLPSDERGGERIALLVSAELVEGSTIFVGCIHLSHIRQDSARRREQLEIVLAHPGWRAPAALRVLGGDFNAAADAPEIAWLEQHPSLTVRAVSTAGYATHPFPPLPDRPGRCIDFLFSVHPPDEAPATARHASVVLDSLVTNVWPSDHAGVLAEFAVPAAG